MNLFYYLKKMPKIILISSDVEKRSCTKFHINKKYGRNIGNLDAPIPLSNVTYNVLEKFIDWCKYHINDEIDNLEDNNRNTYINILDEVDQEIFINFLNFHL